jgi:hypothetical protein
MLGARLLEGERRTQEADRGANARCVRNNNFSDIELAGEIGRVQGGRATDCDHWQSHWTGSNWVKGKPNGPKIPYRLPDIVKSPHANIFIVEGEKDADRLAASGLVATTASEGASTPWAAELNQYFENRDVFVIPDADKAGADHAQDVAKNLHGIATTVKIVELPAGSKDVSDWLDAGGTVEKLGDLCLDAGEWRPGSKADEVLPNVATRTAPELLPFLDMSKWDEEPVPSRKWAVFELIPSRQVSLLSGEGAVGKSILELQRSAAHVLGRDWIGTLPEPGPAIVFNAEDEKDELHRRLAQIADFYSVTFADLIRGGLHVLSFAGKDAVLGHADRHGIVKPTPLFARLCEASRDIKPKSITLDTSADIFAGNENDRGQVRQFISLLRGLAIDADTAVVVCSHPSLTGISSDTGLSGSTHGTTASAHGCILNRQQRMPVKRQTLTCGSSRSKRTITARRPNGCCCAGGTACTCPNLAEAVLNGWRRTRKTRRCSWRCCRRSTNKDETYRTAPIVRPMRQT